MELNGLNALLSRLNEMENDIDDDVDEIVKQNTIEMTANTVENERSRFDKGYWTGNTARNTTTEKVGQAHYKTLVATDYAQYLDKGTRFIEPTYFMRDAYEEQKRKLRDDLDRLMGD